MTTVFKSTYMYVVVVLYIIVVSFEFPFVDHSTYHAIYIVDTVIIFTHQSALCTVYIGFQDADRKSVV